MSERSSSRRGRAGRLAAVLVIAGGAALLGGVWATVDDAGGSGPAPAPEVSVQPLEAAPFGGEVDEDRNEPVELDRGDEPQRFELQIRQLRHHDGAEEPTLEVAAAFEGEESIDEDHDRRVAELRIEPRTIGVSGGGRDEDAGRAAMVGRALDGARFQRSFDRRGHLQSRYAWADETRRAVPLAGVVSSVVEILTPRFPADPVLIGEDWHYDPLEPAGDETVESLEIDADVRERLEGVLVDDDRGIEIAVLERRFELRTPGPVALEGRGRAYFELEAGRLLSSTADLGWGRAAQGETEEFDYDIQANWRSRGR